MLEISFLSIAILYSSIIVFFYIGILREKKRQSNINNWQPKVSIIVPARNEEACIENTLASLAKQDYPTSQLEIIIVDDRSTDDTGKLVEAYIRTHKLTHFKLCTHGTELDQETYKKTAILYALKSASGEIIMTTDADCQVQSTWVSSMIRKFDSETGMVGGLITFAPESESTLFHRLQTLEFAGLVFTGVGAIGNQYPLICNGSNLCYRRAAFDEVGGFAGHEHIPSGDDDLFMQNLHHQTEWKICYNLDPTSINYTKPVDTIAEFFNQRARWASKGAHYPGLLTLLILASIYFFYVALLFVFPAAVVGLFSWKLLGFGFALKLIPEFLVIRQALEIIRRRDLLKRFLIAEIVQIPYIVFAGFAGVFQMYNWKQAK